MKEKLTELIKQAKYCIEEELAEYLISAGLVLPTRCKECTHFDPKKALRPGGIWCEYWGTDPDPEDWCCKGE